MSNAIILLSTYNGERFLPELLDSIVSQDYSNYRIAIRDDGSSDNTLSILEEYQRQHSNLIDHQRDKLGNLGYKKSFETLMQNNRSEAYFFFCDQDDVWAKDKLSAMITQLSSKEQTEPLLVFSEANLIDEDGKDLKHSVRSHTGIAPTAIEQGIFQGCIPGCTMAFNRAAVDAYFSWENVTRNHDLHLHFSTYLLGALIHEPKSLISYRMHGNNTIGFQKTNNSVAASLKDLGKYLFNNKAYRRIVLENYFHIAEAMSNSFGSEVRVPKELFTIEEVDRMGYFARKSWYLRHFSPFSRGRKEGLVRTLCI